MFLTLQLFISKLPLQLSLSHEPQLEDWSRKNAKLVLIFSFLPQPAGHWELA